MRRKICVVITARASYSRIKTVLKAIKQHPFLELQLVITSSALLSRYGSVINYIEQDGFEVTAKIQNLIEGENLVAAAKTVGLGILELSGLLERIKPDAVITIADRFETLATAACASIMNIPLIHIQGGELSGNIDEKIRHAITKLADFHFTATEEAANRILRMGEQARSVINTGCPSIDLARLVLQDEQLDFNPFDRYGGVGNVSDSTVPYLVVMLHPVTTEHLKAREQIDMLFKVVNQIDMQTFWFWPNADTGSDATSKGIRTFREQNETSNIHFFRNFDGLDFLKLLKNSVCLIGNSSVGIRECAYLGVPVVNMGDRQQDRQRGCNVIDVDFDPEKLLKAIRFQKDHGHYPSENIYGKGDSGKMIAQILSEIDLTSTKRMTY